MPSQPQTGRSARVSEHGAALVCPGRSWHVPGNETSHEAFSQNSSSAQSAFWVHVFRSDAGASAEASAAGLISSPVTLESAREGCIAESAVASMTPISVTRDAPCLAACSPHDSNKAATNGKKRPQTLGQARELAFMKDPSRAPALERTAGP